uniref:TPR repeat protein n=1 Tax=Musca domestica TaxID=7370 RepID=T1PHJ2_MUSDO
MVLDIITWFKSNYPVLQLSSRGLPEICDKQHENQELKRVLKYVKKSPDVVVEAAEPEIDFQNLLIENLNWRSVAQFILSLREHLQTNGISLYFQFDFKDVIKGECSDSKSSCTADIVNQENGINNDDQEMTGNSVATPVGVDVNKVSGECSEVQPMDSNNDDSDSNIRTESGETTKNKARRRCSDLHFLEQWGWHKNRRYSSRKKADKEVVDDSLNSYFRRTFSKYMQEIPATSWPFNDNNTEENNSENRIDNQCSNCMNSSSVEEEFDTNTRSEFEQFVVTLKSGKTDLVMLIFQWLKSISKFWNIPLPQHIRHLYIEIFRLYELYYDFGSWHHLPPEDFITSYRICLLFLEITASEEVFSHESWKNIFHHLCFNIGYFVGNNGEVLSSETEFFQIRLNFIRYLVYASKNEYNRCLTCLDEMELMLSQYSPEFVLHLPHSGGYCLNVKMIANTKAQYKSQMDICSLSGLYERQQWSQLIEIITRNVELEGASKNNLENDCWLKDLQTIFEILLQSLWKLRSFESCLAWCEKCLHYSVGNYLDEGKSSNSRQKMVSNFINYVTSYIEAAILNEGRDIVLSLPHENLCRMVQNLIRLVVYQFDGNFEKNNQHGAELDFKPLWSILHQLALRDEEIREDSNTTDETDDLVPASFQILFTAHEYLGRRHWCSNDNGEFLKYILDAVITNFKAPLYDNCRDVMYEYIEQVTYCLFQYPQRKARSKYLEDHEALPIKLNWSRAIQIFDIYKPEQLPEFNSYKLESITSDMEQMLVKVVSLVPKEIDPTQSTHKVVNYIEGLSGDHPAQMDEFMFPYKISNLYYLLADYYFKSRDFTKAIKFYTLDLVINPSRFDSWAGVALSKASQIETKLNGLDQIAMEVLWKECEQVIRCFECCITLDRYQTLLWIEYGSFCYTLQSFFSRCLRGKSGENSELNERKLKLLNIAHNCFTITNNIQNSPSVAAAAAAAATASGADSSDQHDSNDEKWLCQYMLGKISEKRNEDPSVYINNYLSAANYLYESNATYPIKVNHSNPTSLSVEALEVFYRINASIIKYIAREKVISRNHGDLFKKVLKKLANSPFAMNKAKIDGNSLNIIKGKVSEKAAAALGNDNQVGQVKDGPPAAPALFSESRPHLSQHILQGLSRSSSISTVTISSDSSSGGDSDSDGPDINGKNPTKLNDTTYRFDEIKHIYEMVVRNIEECITRFPEHYKSIYRLVNHFMNGPSEFCSLEVAEQLLVGQYKTSLGNVVNGLFYEKKHTNLFNGIWRIPSSEIDRPGSFSAHLVKCVRILILLLLKTKNHKMLMEIALNLHKTPDADKRYIADADRKELCQLCTTYCVQILRDILDENRRERKDQVLLNLQVDIYKIHKKCIKYMNQKESIFTKLLVDVYKFYIEDKVKNIPENCNFLDLAVKLCLQQLTQQKVADKTEIAKEPVVQIPPSLSCAMPPRNLNIQPSQNVTAKQVTGGLPSLPKMDLASFAPAQFSRSGFDVASAAALQQQYMSLEFPQFMESRTADLLLLQGYYAHLLQQREQREQNPNSKTTE